MAFKPKNVSVAQADAVTNKVYKKIVCQVNKFTYIDEISGFFVAQVSLVDEEPSPSTMINNKLFNRRSFSAVGTSILMAQSIKEGQEIEMYGDFELGKYDVQFTVNSIQECVPKKPSAIRLFLSSRIKGIGPKTAHEIVETFGAKTMKVLEEKPELLLEFSGITEKKLETIKSSWKEWKSIYDIIIEMKALGVGDGTSVKIYRHFGDKALDIIKNDPYMLTDVESVGFKIADKIALSAGTEKNSPKRIQRGIMQVLKEATDNGDTALEKNSLLKRAYSLLEIDKGLIVKTIEEMIESRGIIQQDIDIKEWVNREKNEYKTVTKTVVSHIRIYATEFRIVKEINRLLNNNQSWSDVTNAEKTNKFIEENKFDLDESQLEAAKIILNNKFSILTGGPGTGKTHTIKSLIDFYSNYNKADKKQKDKNTITSFDVAELNVVLCAPTGRAAKRMEESTGRKSSTIHRLLGFKDGGFTYGEQNQLSGDVFIIDESSMIDIWLMNALMKAIPSNARVIMVGDTDQLESVGAGKVLGDLIDSKKVAVARLSKIHRQALGSNIITAAYDIIHRKMPQLHDINSTSDFVFVEREHNEDIQQEILSITADLVHNGVKHDNIQILSPKKDGDIGTFKLNHELRPILNPNFLKYESKDNHYLPGDRVMQFKNNKKLDLFNGDVGKVISYDGDEIMAVIDFDDKKVTVEKQELNDINYSFATTVHKSQGSDYPVVIIPVAKSHSFMWNVNLLYTGVTRGKEKVILVGDKKTLLQAVSNFKKTERLTNLRSILESHIGVENEQVKEAQESIKKIKP